MIYKTGRFKARDRVGPNGRTIEIIGQSNRPITVSDDHGLVFGRAEKGSGTAEYKLNVIYENGAKLRENRIEIRIY